MHKLWAWCSLVSSCLSGDDLVFQQPARALNLYEPPSAADLPRQSEGLTTKGRSRGGWLCGSISLAVTEYPLVTISPRCYPSFSFEAFVLLWIRRPPRPIANTSKDWSMN